MSPSLAGILGSILGASVVLVGVFVRARLSGQSLQATYRLAAVDKRLKAHQEAFTHWINIYWNVDDRKVVGLVVEAQKWWTKNCIYLDTNSRVKFLDFLNNVHDFSEISNDEERNQHMAEFYKVGNLILEGVALPPIGECLANEIKGV